MKKIIILVMVLILAAAFAELGLAIAKPRANFNLNVAPSNAKLILDNHRAINPGGNYIKPGKHTLTATLNGFASNTQRFIIQPYKSLALNIVLNPDSQVGYDYLTSNQNQELEREKLGGQKVTSGVELQQKLYPIIKLLPYDGLGYSINYGADPSAPNDPSKIALVISYTDGSGEVRALNWVKFEGFDPSDYKIIYKGASAS